MTGLLAFATIAIAGAEASAQTDARAAEILAAARAAIGGQIDTLDTLSVDATVQRNVGSLQLTSELEILLDLPDRFLRIETPRGGMGQAAATGFAGEALIRPAGMTATPGGGVMIRIGPGGSPPQGEPLSPEDQAKADAAMRRSLEVDASRLMLGWLARVHPAVDAAYTYVGVAESPDGRAHVIEAADAAGFRARLFIDQATSLPLMVTYQAVQPRMITMQRRPLPAGERRGGAAVPSAEERAKERQSMEGRIAAMQKEPPVPVEHTVYFDEWRETGGIRFPHSIRRAAEGTTNEEWMITRVRVNPRIDAAKFRN